MKMMLKYPPSMPDMEKNLLYESLGVKILSRDGQVDEVDVGAKQMCQCRIVLRKWLIETIQNGIDNGWR